MTEEFIRKRIDEQINYIAEIMLSDRTSERKNEILPSACGQLSYFRSKLHKEVIRRNEPFSFLFCAVGNKKKQ